MRAIDDLTLSVTARLVHQLDFAFEKDNLDIANHLRNRFLSDTSFGGASSLKGVSIDEDDDISLRTNDKGSWYVTDSSVMVIGRVGTLKNLSDNKYIDELARAIEWLFEQRSSFWAESYEARLFFFERPLHRLAALDSLCDASLKSLLGDMAPSSTKTFRVATKYENGAFRDSLDLDVSEEVRLRFSRAAKAASFDSFGKFLRDADLRGATERLRPLLEAFTLDDPVRFLSSLRSAT